MGLRVQILKRHGDFTLDAGFELPTPGIAALFGRSGCGKTTAINVIAGLLPAQSAVVELDGTVLQDTGRGAAVPAEHRRIGYVFQDARLFPHLSVAGNLNYGLKRARVSPPTIDRQRIVTLLGLQTLLKRRPHQLSGGERQRVALGRALLSQPRLLLLDEPLASLDIARREEVLPYLEILRDSLSIPMVYVSHQFDEVLRLATHVVLMDAGRVLAQGSLHDISLLPALRSIVGSDAVGAVVEGAVIDVEPHAGLAAVRVGSGTLKISVREAKVGDRVRVQLLARDIILATEEPRALSVRNQLPGRIIEITPDEDDALLVKIDAGGSTILSRVTRNAVTELNLEVGTGVWVLVKAVSTRGHAFRLPAAG